MKKFILMLLMVFTIGVFEINAQIYYYRTTAFAYKQLNYYGQWTNWSDWEYSNIPMTINYSSDVVKVYSKTPQVYTITEYVRNYTDSSGGQQAEYRFIDQDGDRGTMRLRIETNGNSQLYIEFNNIIWVYNVVRTG